MQVKKYLPSLLTLSNLFLGFLAILYINRGANYFEIACYLILIASLLDVFDGKLARKIGIASEFGKEIDSLADLISFCLAPSFLIFNMYYNSSIHPELFYLYLAFISSLPVLMGAIRLARFNVTHITDSKKGYFIGLPSPAIAISICTIVMLKIKYAEQLTEYFNYNIFELNIIATIIILLSFLMIGKIQFSKFPIISFNVDRQNSIRLILLLSAISIFIISSINNLFEVSLFFLILYYIISNILFHFIDNSIRLNKLKQKLGRKKSSDESTNLY